MFARLWNLTLAEFDRLAYLIDEDHLLLRCRVVVVLVAALSVSRQVVGPSSHLTAQPVEILIQEPQRT